MRSTINFNITLLVFIVLSCGCNPEGSDSAASDGPIEQSKAPTDFQEFYVSFHTDTNFQLEHITFPLQGMPSVDTGNMDYSQFKWEKKNWKWHSLDNFDPKKYQVRRNVLDSTLVTETIQEKNSGMGIKRRFAKFNGEWFLIYYSAMNPMK